VENEAERQSKHELKRHSKSIRNQLESDLQYVLKQMLRFHSSKSTESSDLYGVWMWGVLSSRSPKPSALNLTGPRTRGGL